MDFAFGDPDKVEEITLPVLSGSMAPVLLPGDKIVIKRASLDDCRQGDIIVFRDNNGLTAHRMLFRLPVLGGTYLFQKGDCNRFGNWISSNRIVGIVIESRSESGRKKSFSSTSERKQAQRKAFLNIFRDCTQRIIFIPRMVIPRRLKACIKNIFYITIERHTSDIK